MPRVRKKNRPYEVVEVTDHQVNELRDNGLLLEIVADEPEPKAQPVKESDEDSAPESPTLSDPAPKPSPKSRSGTPKGK